MKRGNKKIAAKTLATFFLSACFIAGTSCSKPGVVADVPAPRTINTITINNTPRSYILRLPPKYDGKQKLPLVMMIHGANDSAEYAEAAYHLVEKSTAENFILVLPDSNSDFHAWNGFAPDTPAAPNNDLAFLTTLLQTLPQHYAIDTHRIYVCGHSSGAMMTYRLIAEHPDLIAAAGIVSGEVDPSIQPKAPMPLIIFHGKLDPTVSYENLAPAVDFWKTINKCDLASRSPIHQDLTPNVTEDFYPSPTTADITVYTLQNGNHMWPGGVPMPGKTQIPVQDISATDLMWTFFQAHSR